MDYVTTSTGQPDIYQSPTGALRDSQNGKPRYDLVHPLLLRRLAGLLARGAEKYGENNWTKGQETNRTVASLLRHVYAYIEGAELGENGDKEDHLAAIAFNVMSLMVVEDGIREGRYPQALQTIEARQPFFQATPSETYAAAVGAMADAIRDTFNSFLIALRPSDEEINQQPADAVAEDADDDEAEAEEETSALLKVLLAEPYTDNGGGQIDLAEPDTPVAWKLPYVQLELQPVTLKKRTSVFDYRYVPIEIEIVPHNGGWLPESFPCKCPSCQLVQRYYPVKERVYGQKSMVGVVSYPLPVRLGAAGFRTDQFNEEEHLAYRAFLESYPSRYKDTSYSY
jgi:hypothetical protein